MDVTFRDMINTGDASVEETFKIDAKIGGNKW